jgi:hypothetical protein
MHDDSNSKILECLLCLRRYSREDILAGLYRLETLICSPCYAKMQGQALTPACYARSCFGKPSIMIFGGRRLRGYNPAAKECNKLCPDREVCRRVILHYGPV